jgi:hypothetical protein
MQEKAIEFVKKGLRFITKLNTLALSNANAKKQTIKPCVKLGLIV